MSKNIDMGSKAPIQITGSTRESVEEGDLAFWIYMTDGRAVQCAPQKGSQVSTPSIQSGQFITLEGEFSEELHIPEFPLFRFQRFEFGGSSAEVSPPIANVDLEALRYSSPL
jgi:hypothetical protein